MISVVCVTLIINNHRIQSHPDKCQIVDVSGINLQYSANFNKKYFTSRWIHQDFTDDTKSSYYVNFNKTIMQANYVKYVSTSGGNGCKKCSFRNDLYGESTLKTSDYTNTNFDRGHLVPNADLGYATYVMTNVVPMKPNFNRGVWKQSEEYIRNEHAGKLIYKGCDYDGNVIETDTRVKLYIPVGCYYLIFDGESLVDYGYYKNERYAQLEKKLPYWCRST